MRASRPLYWFAYGAPSSLLKRKRSSKDGTLARIDDSLHMLRDGQAFVELQAALVPRFRFERCLLNLPAEAYGLPAADVGLDHLEPESLIVLATRPPLDDGEKDRRALERSHTPLEKAVLGALRPLFDECSRKAVVLSEALRPASTGKLRGVETRVYGPARAVGWAVGVPVAQSGVRVVAVFGLDGTQTFLWAHLVRTKLRRELLRLAQPGPARVLVAELPPHAEVRTLPGTLDDVLGDAAPRISVRHGLNPGGRAGAPEHFPPESPPRRGRR